MKRNLLGPCVALLCLSVLATAAAAADTITYFKKGKKETAKGHITEETPRAIVYTVGQRTEKLPAADVLEVDYELRATHRKELGTIFGKERKANDLADVNKRVAALDEVVAAFRSFLPNLDSERLAQRNLEFIIANVLIRQADDDPSRLGPAIDALKEFMKKHEKSWQIATVGKQLARLQMDKGDVKGARATYEELASMAALAAEVRQECDLLVVKTLIRAGSLADAEKKLADLAKASPKDDPQAVRVEIYQAACQANGNLAAAEKRLKAVLDSKADNAIKALAFNTLGDCYRMNNRAADAFWQYLWVDVYYGNQDREEHAKALYYLSVLFEKVRKTPARAQACRDRLLNDKLFAGLEYQKLAAKENQK